MRLFPLLLAAAVVAAIYMLVMERDMLIGLATGTATEEAAEQAQDTAAPEDAPTAESAAEPRRVAVVARAFTRAPVTRTVLLRGRTEAARMVEVLAETSGRVISDPHRKGSTVEEGELLCRLRSGPRDAALREAESRLAEADLNYTAASRLSAEGFAADTRLASARAAREAAEAAVDSAREELERLEITAPFGGVLETDTAELGALLQPGAPCATIHQLDPIRVVGFVPESQVDRIDTGARAGARLSSGREVTGRVTFVARTADPQTRTFRVEVTVDNEQLDIRAGQSADMLIAATGDEGHLVPGSAMTLNDEGRIGLRLVDESERARFHEVEVLRDTADGVWVAGLPERASIIVVGQEFVSEGSLLDVTMQDAAETSPQDGVDDRGPAVDSDALDDAPADGAAAPAEDLLQ